MELKQTEALAGKGDRQIPGAQVGDGTSAVREESRVGKGKAGPKGS